MSLIKSFPTIYPRLDGQKIADSLSVRSNSAKEAISIRLSLANALLDGNTAQAHKNVLADCSARYGLFKAHADDFFAKTSPASDVDALEIAILMGDVLPEYATSFFIKNVGREERIFTYLDDDQFENPLLLTDVAPSTSFFKNLQKACAIFSNDPPSVEGEFLAHIHTIENANHRENRIHAVGTTVEEAHSLKEKIEHAKRWAHADTNIGHVLLDRLDALKNVISKPGREPHRLDQS